MKKDVIYIDVDDDVTAIIGKVKEAKEKVVAVVPPKRAGALQSAVNLRLLDRMAKAEKKQLVLVTHNPALVGLAANAMIPVAKTLQSKPELAEMPAALVVDDDDDIINGAELPVGDHAGMIPVVDGTREPRSEAIESVDLDLPDDEIATEKQVPVKDKKAKKVPNFNSFRKKLFLGIGGGLALIALFVWMFVFAPAATIVITAKTTEQPLTTTATLSETGATDFKTGVIRTSTQEKSVDESVEFEATGEANVGERATGTMTVSILTQNDYAVPQGTTFTIDGQTFRTDTAATIPASTPCFPAYCAQSADVGVTATAPGTDSNGITGSTTNSQGIRGELQGATAGGTDKIAKVVTESDVELARGKLTGRSTDERKAEVEALFTQGEKVISSSFTTKKGKEKLSSPVGEEAPNGKASLTVPTVYRMNAVPVTDLEIYLKAYLEDQLDEGQKIYNSGAEKATLSNFKTGGETTTVTVNAKGSIGPAIDESRIKEQSMGKIYGEVQSSLEAIPGVQAVDVQFSYFWVRTVPDNTDKIQVKFDIENE